MSEQVEVLELQVFVWKDTDPVTDNYHGGGGLLVVAGSLEEARGLLSEALSGVVARASHLEPVGPSWLSVEPDLVLPLVAGFEFVGDRVVVFPDAGCC